MSTLWVQAESHYDPVAAHDEEQGFQRKIGDALESSGLTYHAHPDNPDFRRPAGCHGNGDCIATHTVPMEGGFHVYMHQRNGRMDPFITHSCPGREVNGILPPTDETFSHPLSNLSVARTPTETLGEAMKSFAFSPGAMKSMMSHRCADTVRVRDE